MFHNYIITVISYANVNAFKNLQSTDFDSYHSYIPLLIRMQYHSIYEQQTTLLVFSSSTMTREKNHLLKVSITTSTGLYISSEIGSLTSKIENVF